MHRTLELGQYRSTVSLVERGRLYDGIESESFYVADANTVRHAPDHDSTLTLPPGEASKTWDRLHGILTALLDAGLSRSATVIGIGGGAVTDVVACAANLYLRGCRVVLVPTSLLAMVDAAVGGKTGINFGGYKNMVGTFYPAHEVRICTELLTTLPDREFKSGLAEVIKSALLGDADLLSLLENEREPILERDDTVVRKAVWACVNVKGDVVEEDLRESGIRAHLNLGHTFGHALEAVAGLGQYSHGEAVAWGMAQAMELGRRIGITSETYSRRVIDLLASFGYRVDPIPELAEKVRSAMNRDKKREGSQVRFVLQRDLNDTVVVPADETVLAGVLEGARG